MSDMAERMNGALLEMRRHGYSSPMFWLAWVRLAALVEQAKERRR